MPIVPPNMFKLKLSLPSFTSRMRLISVDALVKILNGIFSTNKQKINYVYFLIDYFFVKSLVLQLTIIFRNKIFILRLTGPILIAQSFFAPWYFGSFVFVR